MYSVYCIAYNANGQNGKRTKWPEDKMAKGQKGKRTKRKKEGQKRDKRTKDQNHKMFLFLAALSSSRTTVVGPSVRRSVGRSTDVCEKVTFRVSKGN